MMYSFYAIKNYTTNKYYIGKTVNFERRILRHFSELKSKKHHSYKLSIAYSSYGEDDFGIQLLKTYYNLTEEESSKIEQGLISDYQAFTKGYNGNDGRYNNNNIKTTRLNKTQVFHILSALKYCSRPGGALEKIFGVNRTYISRIKLGNLFHDWHIEFHGMTEMKQRIIYQELCDLYDFETIKANSTVLQSKRKLSKEQVFFMLALKDSDIDIDPGRFKKMFNIKSANTFKCIYEGNSYQDFALEYKDLSKTDKETILHHYIEMYRSKAS